MPSLILPALAVATLCLGVAACSQVSGPSAAPPEFMRHMEDVKPDPRQTAARNAARLRGLETTTFSRIQSARMATLSHDRQARDAFRGHSSGGAYFHLSSPWRTLDDPRATELAQILDGKLRPLIASYSAPGEGQVAEMGAFCIPMPGLALELETDRGRRDLLVCLECGHVEIYDAAGRHAGIWIGSDDTPRLRALLAPGT